MITSGDRSTSFIILSTFLGGTALVYYIFSKRHGRRINTDDKFVAPTLMDNVLGEFTKKKTNSTGKCIYLDFNGTTPIYDEVLQEMLPYLRNHFGNPSSSHFYGIEPKRGLETARRRVMTMLGLSTKSESDLEACIFTGCGTESNNLAIKLAITFFNVTRKMLRPHIVTSNVEHPAIFACLESYKNEGKCDVTYVPVQEDGRVLACDVLHAIQPNHTALVTLMLANNESGALQPIREVAEYCRQQGILMHVDAAQAVGKVSVNLNELCHPDMVTVVGHKIGAPKGVACLYIRPRCFESETWEEEMGNMGLLLGGGQEFGLRAGTENVASIVALGKACELCSINWKTNKIHMEKMRSLLLQDLISLLGEKILRVNGPTDSNARLPNTLSISVKGVHSGMLLKAINQDLAISAGAACHSNGSNSSISHVLRAMKIPDDLARGTLRLSIGPATNEGEIHEAAVIVADAVHKFLASNLKMAQS